MVDCLEAVGALIRTAATAAHGAGGDIDPAVRHSEHADLQADLAPALARTLGTAPRIVAERIAAALPPNDVIARIAIAGPGFLNITVRDEWLAGAVERMAVEDRLGHAPVATPGRVVIDYSHPNVAKEMHVGHLRSTVIGDALARVFAWRGHTVLRQNHIGDWGAQFGMLMEQLADDGVQQLPEIATLHATYRRANQRFKDDPAFAERARRRVVALQSGDDATRRLWRALVDNSIAYFEGMYDRLGVTLAHADLAGESTYNPQLAPLAAELEAAGYARVSEGALCAFPEGFCVPLILRNRDGGYGYAATDLAALRHRICDLHATHVLYVVGAPQTQHLAMVFAAARELGWLSDACTVEHVAFGSVLGADGKMLKSRSGHAARLADVLDEAVAAARAEVAARHADVSAAELDETARIVGIGAVKYADLASDRVNDVVFDMARMTRLEGDTSGYVQYACARARSVVANAGGVTAARVRLVAPEERALAIVLTRFGAAVRTVERKYQPHRLVGYVQELSRAFTRFYETCPVLKADADLRASRVVLTHATARALAEALGLLGISVPARM